MKTKDKPRRSGGRSGRKSAFWSGALALGAVGVSAQSVKAQDAGDLASIESTRVQPDGSLSVVLSDGRSLSLSPDEYEIVDGAVVIDPPVAEALGLASSGSGLTLPLLGGVAAGVAALAGGAAALAGGGDPGGSNDGESVNEAPVFTYGATASASVAENTDTAVYTPVVTDAEGDTLEFNLSGGADAALFDIDATTGVVTFKPDHLPDYENPGDTDGGNDYDIVITASDGTNSTAQAVTITVTNVNDEAPVFTSEATASVAENTPVETAVYTPIVTDADGDTLEFTLSGTDAALFDIDVGTGVVTFKAAPDYENPGDAGEDNVYDIVITASDGTHSTDQAVTITVTNVNDEAPVFTSGATASVAENTPVETAVYTPIVTDADGDTLQFALSGTDAELFDINANTGVVTFKTAPDYEAPGDLTGDGSVAGDNVYDIVITASDGTHSTTQAVTITVTNVNDEAPVFTSGATTSASVAENTDTAVYTPTVTDADGDTLTFSLSGTDAGLFDIDPGTGVVTFKTAPDYEAPGDLAGDGSVAGDNVYDIVITASDGTHSTDQAVAITVTDVAGDDDPPVFTSGATASVAENTPVETAVYTPTVTDADGGPLTFTLSGADAALFDIVPGTGVVTFKAAPDFENPGDLAGDGSVAGNNDYDIVITASDGTNSTDQAVTITVTDVHEPASVLLDLSNISTTEGIIIWDDGANDQTGRSVSSAGDVNGDGFDDLIVGARFGDDGGIDAGEAYVLYGGTGLVNIDLSTLTADQGFIIQGDTAGDRAGYSVSSAGDVNGDGFDDLIVGAPFGDDGGRNAGEAYVIYGGTGLANIDLTNLTVTQGFIIQGDAAGDYAGYFVSSAGDVNGDGFDDLIVGAPLGDDGGLNAGEAYVIYGGTELANIDLTNLTVTQGFIIQGDGAHDRAGHSVSSAGDVNGDGFDDLIVGAPYGDDGGIDAGEAYVLYGGTELATIDLTNLTVAQGFIIQGDAAGDRAGRSVSSAGDVNGDGFDDLIVGAPYGDDGGDRAGEAYVIYGGTGLNGEGLATIDLSDLTTDQGFIIRGDEGGDGGTGDQAGFSVSSAGDVNGDGFDDLIVGAPYGDDGGNDAGEAYVIYGGTGLNGAGLANIDLSTLTAAQGFIIQGDRAFDRVGTSVSSAGDVNGDGFDDLIVGAPYGDEGGFNAGEAYVLYGGATGTESTLTVTRAGTDGVADNFTGNAGNDIFTGIGANDVVRGGAGDDSITLTDLNFAKVDGGHGDDTLLLGGSGMTLDLTGARTDVESFETIDLTGTGDNTLVIDALSLLDLSGDTANGITTFKVTGDTGDQVTLTDTGWSADGQRDEDGVTFDVYANGQAEIWIEEAVTVNI